MLESLRRGACGERRARTGLKGTDTATNRTRLDLGLGLLSFNLSPASAHGWQQSYRAAARIAEEADSSAIESIFLSEHHFVADGYCPALLPVAAGLLSTTHRLVVGTAALLLPLADKRRVARQLRDLGSLRDRLRLGIALGYRDEEFRGFERSKRERGKLMDASIEHLLGECGRQTLVICAASPPGVARALKYGLPLLVDSSVPVQTALEWIETFRAESDEEITLIREVWVSDDGSAPPQSVAERGYAFWQYLSWNHWDHPPPDTVLSETMNLTSAVRRTEESWLRTDPQRFSSFTRDLARRGVDRLVARIAWSGRPFDHDVVQALIEASSESHQDRS